jgi:hypothetical protein
MRQVGGAWCRAGRYEGLDGGHGSSPSDDDRVAGDRSNRASSLLPASTGPDRRLRRAMTVPKVVPATAARANQAQ